MRKNNSAQPTPFAMLLSRHRLKAELVLSALVLAAWFAWPNKNILMPAMMALAGVYFLSAYVLL